MEREAYPSQGTQTLCLFLAFLLGWPLSSSFSQSSIPNDAMVPVAAQSAVARRQDLIHQADTAAKAGQKSLSDADYEAATAHFRRALSLLPDAPIVQDRRRDYTQNYATSSVQLARIRAQEGRYAEAIQLTSEVLDPTVDPTNLEAKQLLLDLNDPEIYSPALTPEHLARVKEVDYALTTAASNINLGNYDQAERDYHKVLSFDPYNSAARRGLERVEQHRIRYYDTAYNQTRATFIREIAKQWELTPPRYSIDANVGNQGALDASHGGVAYIQEKLKRIIIPEIEFENTPLRDALNFLRFKSQELDTLEADPSLRGVNIILKTPGESSPRSGSELGFDTDTSFPQGSSTDPIITLRLTSVPLLEALRYTTELARLTFKVEPHAVVVVPLSEAGEDLYTVILRPPPSFLTGSGPEVGSLDRDPFSGLSEPLSGELAPRKTAREILEDAGVTFPEGASAIYNKTTSQLIVRNTQTQLDLIQAYIDSLNEGVEKQIYITSKFLEIRQDDTDEFGFDWTLGEFGIGTDRIQGSGGTTGNTRNELNSLDYPFTNANGDVVGGNPVSSSLRSGNIAAPQNTLDSLLSANPDGQTDLAPGVLSLAGVMTDPEFQVVLRAVSQHTGSDLLSAPSVVARSGQRAKIEVIREFIYPSEYDPPEIPQDISFGTTDNNGNLVGGSTANSFPVTPANPTAFVTRNVGVTLEVDPQIGPDGYTIDLNMSPEVVEFEGFINYGSPIFSSGTGAGGEPIQLLLTENRIEMPVFALRKVSTSVTLWDGQTVAIGGLIREDSTLVQDKLPILGDIPGLGFLFQSETDVREKRNLSIFVTAKLIDPSGQSVNTSILPEQP